MAITYCNANDAARMTREFWNTKEQKAKEIANKLYPEVMTRINDEIVSAASAGQGKCKISLKRLSSSTDWRCLKYLQEKVEEELTETLGYRVTSHVDNSLDITWCTDV